MKIQLMVLAPKMMKDKTLLCTIL